jgi:hypothetical protein
MIESIVIKKNNRILNQLRYKMVGINRVTTSTGRLEKDSQGRPSPSVLPLNHFDLVRSTSVAVSTTGNRKWRN